MTQPIVVEMDATQLLTTLNRIRDDARVTGQAMTDQMTRAISSVERGITQLNRAQTTGTAGWRTNTAAVKTATTAHGGLTKALNATGVGYRGLIQRSREAEKALLAFTSGVRGVELGTAIMNRNILAIGRQLVQLRFSMIGVTLATAGLTLAFESLVKISTAAFQAGRALEDFGQMASSFLRSGAQGQALETLADGYSRTFGVARSEMEKTLFTLARWKMQGDTYTKAILNAGAATGQKPSAVADQFSGIIDHNTGKAQQSAMQNFAREYDLPLKNYNNTLELAIALNERYKGSIEAYAQTTSGMIGRVRAGLQGFLAEVGTVVTSIVGPLFGPVIGLFDGLIKGFHESKVEGTKTYGQLSQILRELNYSAQALIPAFEQLGRILGHVLYSSAVAAARALKILLDTMRSGLQWLKEHRDLFTSVGQSFKKNFLDVILGSPVKLAVVGTFFTTFFKSIFEGFGESIKSGVKDNAPELTDAEGKSIIEKIFGVFKRTPKALFEGTFEALKAGLIMALVEALVLTAIDFLPVSENIKNSLNGMVRLTFTAAALGMIFGPVGALIAGAIALALSAGLELIAPGSSKKVADWIDSLWGKGFNLIVTGINNYFLPALKKVQDWFAGPTKGKVDEFGNALQPMGQGGAGYRAVQDFLGVMDRVRDKIRDDIAPQFLSISQKVGTDLYNAALKTKNYLKDHFLPGLGEIYDEFKKDFNPVLNDAIKLFKDDILPAVTNLTDFFVTKFMPELLDLVKYFTVTFLPVGEKVAILFKDTLVGSLKILGPVLDTHLKVVQDIGTGYQHIWDVIGDPSKTGFGKLYNFWKFTFEGEATIVAGILTTIVGLLDHLATSDWGVAWGGFLTVLGNIASKIGDVLDLLSWIPGVPHYPGKSGTGAVPTTDGTIPGYTRDPVTPPTPTYTGPYNPATPPLNPSAPGENDPPIPHLDMGGTVPGRIGTHRMVLAAAGERFLGHPGFRNQSMGQNWANAAAGGGGGGTTLVFDMRGAYLVNKDEVANSVASIISTKLVAGRPITRHRL